MKLLNEVLKQHKQIILSIPHDGELSWMNDDSSDSDWTNHYLATITVQYVLDDSYIAFDSECLVKVKECGKAIIEEFDTSPDAHQTHHDNISDIDGHDIDEIHYDNIVTDKPDFMMVEWY